MLIRMTVPCNEELCFRSRIIKRSKSILRLRIFIIMKTGSYAISEWSMMTSNNNKRNRRIALHFLDLVFIPYLLAIDFRCCEMIEIRIERDDSYIFPYF